MNIEVLASAIDWFTRNQLPCVAYRRNEYLSFVMREHTGSFKTIRIAPHWIVIGGINVANMHGWDICPYTPIFEASEYKGDLLLSCPYYSMLISDEKVSMYFENVWG